MDDAETRSEGRAFQISSKSMTWAKNYMYIKSEIDLKS